MRLVSYYLHNIGSFGLPAIIFTPAYSKVMQSVNVYPLVFKASHELYEQGLAKHRQANGLDILIRDMSVKHICNIIDFFSNTFSSDRLHGIVLLHLELIRRGYDYETSSYIELEIDLFEILSL